MRLNQKKIKLLKEYFKKKPLVIRNRFFYLSLLNKAEYEAMDWYHSVDIYYHLFKSAKSLTAKTKN